MKGRITGSFRLLFNFVTLLNILLGFIIFNNIKVVESTEISCYGIAASNSSVCSGRGSCISQDVCSCMGTNSSQAVDYLQNFDSGWGVRFYDPSPNTLFNSYEMNRIQGNYPNISISTKNKAQDMWWCNRMEGELILNDVPRNVDGSIFNEWSYEAVIDMKARGGLTHIGVVVWRNNSLNPNNANYFIGSGPTDTSKLTIAVNNEKYCDVLPEDLINHYSDGPFTFSSSQTHAPLLVRKNPLGYKFYYKTATGTDWIHYGTVPTTTVYDKVGIFIKQWSIIIAVGGPLSFDVSGMGLKVSKFTGASCNVTSCFGVASTSSQVCNGNGACTDFNTCVCNDGFSGSTCLTSSNNSATTNNSTLNGNGTLTNNTDISNNNTVHHNVSDNSNTTNPVNPVVSDNSTTWNNTSIDNSTNTSSGNSTSNSTNSSNSTTNGNNTIQDNSTVIQNNTNVYNSSNNSNTTVNNSTVITNSSTYENSTIPQNSTNSNNNSSPSAPKYVCNGISSDNSSVCNSKGNCTDSGCVCVFGYYGSNCAVPLCFDIPSSDKNVCSGQGECISPNQCKCKTGFEGETCNSFKCYGISKSSSSVCGGHGSCTAVDTCSCLSNWNGNSQCTECNPSFSGVNCTEAACSAEKTCNGRGTCGSNKNCICSDNFSGEFCTNCTAGYFGSNCDNVCTPARNCSSHGNCNSMGECVCSGHFSGKTCSSCQTGWYGENCDYSVSVSSFSFNKNGDVITGTVYSPISTKFECSYFIAAESLPLIGGSDASCLYTSSENSFQIILGSSTTIVPGSTLMFYSDLLKKTNFVSVIVSTGSLVSNPPDAVLKSDKSIVSTCDKVSFDASSSSSSDRRALTYSWSSSSATLNNMINSLKTSVVTIQANALNVGSYSVVVKVTNQFGYSSNQTLSFSVVTTVVPFINIPEEVQVLIGGSSIIVPSITFPSCYSGNSSLLKVSYSVELNSVDTSLKLSTSNRMLIFGSGYTSIKKEGNYYFKATVTADQALETSVIFLVKAISQPLELSFNVTDFSQGYDELVSFSAVKNDPSATSDSDSLTIACFKISTNTGCGSVSSPFSQLLQPGKYSFTATYSKGSRSIQKVLLVTILSDSKDKIIKASISAKPQGISQSIDLSAVDSSQDVIFNSNLLDSLSNPSYKWTSSNLDLTNLETSLSYIIIPKSSLVPGLTISLDLLITDGNKNGSASISFTVNFPPTRGVFEVFPQSGYSLDEFDLKCGNGWNDPQAPLSYQYFFNDGTYWKPLSEKVVDLKSIRVRLASGSSSNSYKVPVKVVVSDAKGASTESILQVKVENLSVEQTFKVLSSISSQVATISSTDASNALLVIGSVTSSSLDATQKEKISQAANNLVSAVISTKSSQSSLVPETSDSAISTASVISNAIPAVTGGFITDKTTSLIISTLASTTETVASVKSVNFDLNTISSVIAATNALSGYVSTRRRSLNLFTDDDLKNLGVTYTNIVAASTKNNAPDMPASVVIGNGVVGYSRKLSSPSMNNFYDILYNSNTITLSSTFSKLIPNVASASLRFMIYDKRNAVSKFSLGSDFDMFTKVIEFNIVPENSYSPFKLSNTNLVKLRMQTLKNETSLPQNTELICKKYDDSKDVFSTDSGCTVGTFVKDSVVADISSTGAYTLTTLVKQKTIISQASLSYYCNIIALLFVLIVTLFLH
ncbi:predicted protein [Naegleria gruberi]|uniref:Delta-like protein n=1 Tax=Naegleria gruberi TaxID=5762 RepID=D2VI32_NAEGR|nr:uncharacterized protein NAEGRDRAFT_68543 [Naegleria gruberi]EFC43520.1 predicted protein [Naegleria gruberi]|eukprot:XP_002676264.1 predicted protein [Naegleria gruberi strain NEG-M]